MYIVKLYLLINFSEMVYNWRPLESSSFGEAINNDNKNEI